MRFNSLLGSSSARGARRLSAEGQSPAPARRRASNAEVVHRFHSNLVNVVQILPSRSSLDHHESRIVSRARSSPRRRAESPSLGSTAAWKTKVAAVPTATADVARTIVQPPTKTQSSKKRPSNANALWSAWISSKGRIFSPVIVRRQGPKTPQSFLAVTATNG